MATLQNFQKIIYLVDDDPDDRILFLDAVQDINLAVEVQELQDGQELIDFLDQTPPRFPEFIFLDINMPRKTGLDCLSEIKKYNGALKNTKVIMLSTSNNHFNVKRSFDLGADFYAVKPNTFAGLKNLVKEVLEKDWNQETLNKQKLLIF